MADDEGAAKLGWADDEQPQPAPEQQQEELSSSPITADADGDVHERCNLFRPYWALSISIVLIILFVISFAVQFNDEDLSAMWSAFYLLSALLILMALVFRRTSVKGSTVQSAITMLSAGLLVWSVVLTIVSAVDLSSVDSGGPDAGGDNPNATDKEEIAYELAGACLGFVSAAYHLSMLRGYCCFAS